MKKSVFFLLMLVVATGFSSFGQAHFANYTSSKVVVADESGHTEAVVNPKSKAAIAFLPSDGIATFTLYKYEGFKKVKVGIIKRRVIKKTITLKDFSPEAEAEVVKPDGKQKDGKEKKEKAEESTNSDEPIQIAYGDGEWWSETTVVPSNETDFRLTVLTAPFKGLSLKSKQASKRSKTLNTGICEFVIYYDEEVDSISSGRSYNWAVFNKIIAEGQDTLKITNHDLRQTTIGKAINAPIINKFQSDLVITAGPNSGKVIPSKGMVKLDLMVGWNVLSVQYIKNGLPVQAVALFMVSDKKKSFSLEKGKGVTSIDFKDLTVLSR